MSLRAVVAGEAVIVLPPDAPEPSPAVVERLVGKLARSGADALCAFEPVTDALVVVDADGRVVRHLDRSLHGRISVPQVVSARWWGRVANHLVEGHEGGPAAALLALGGRVSPLPSTLSVDAC